MSRHVVTITDDQRQQYQEEGYFILERAIPEDHLALLRGECERFIALIDNAMDRAGTDVLGLSHRNNRYFVKNQYRQSERLHEFIFSDLMAEICRSTLGKDAYLFFESYVVKYAEVGMKFGWHQDSGYLDVDHRPYVTCWCALDDMSEANGTIYILPYSRVGHTSKVEHVREHGTNDQIGYFGDDPGVPVLVSAGSIAVFSSTTFHRSGANATDRMRRVYLPQYSSEPIMRVDGQGPVAFAEPFLKDDRIIGRSA